MLGSLPNPFAGGSGSMATNINQEGSRSSCLLDLYVFHLPFKRRSKSRRCVKREPLITTLEWIRRMNPEQVFISCLLPLNKPNQTKPSLCYTIYISHKNNSNKKGKSFCTFEFKFQLEIQNHELLKDVRKSVKAKKAAFGPLHLATTGTKVSRMWQV